MAIVSRFRSFWPALAAIASVAMLAAAHAFETFGGYAPCGLCLHQREVYWAALAVAAAGWLLVRSRRFAPEIVALLLAAVFTAGAVLAAFHAGVEWKWWPGPTSCSGGGIGTVALDDLSGLLTGDKVRPPACDEAAWRLLGISMAGYNAMISLGLAALGFLAAFHRSSPEPNP
jgi:disulfide bond formation protein DsbB